MAKVYCRDSFFPTKHIANLPKQFTFNNGKKTFMVDYGTQDLLHFYKTLIKDAAIRGDNVGVDEYNENDIKTELLFDFSEIFQATDPSTGHIEAVMFIQHCFYQRAFDSCSATVHVFRSSGIDNVVYAELANLMGDFAQALDIGYTQVCVHVAFGLTDLYLELRKQGFVTVTLFPEWVELAGVGVDDSALMVKQLDSSNRKPKSMEHLLKAINSKFTPEKVQSTYFSSGCVPVPILPITLTTKQGVKFTFRNARMEEDELMYKMMSDAGSEGDGYAIDEYPTLDFFRIFYLADSAAVIIEEEATKTMAGVLIFLQSIIYRRATSSVADPAVIIKKEYRGSGLSLLARVVMILVERSVGFKREFGMTFSTNKATLKTWKNSSFPTIGTFPNGAHQGLHGWMDLVYGSISLEDDAGLLSKLTVGHLISSVNGKAFESKL